MTHLRQLRIDRGWTQDRAVAELRSRSRRVLPDTLKIQLSRWENGRVVPGAEYRSLLCQIYHCTDHDLGVPTDPDGTENRPSTADTDAELLAMVATGRAAGHDVAHAYREQIDQTRVLDRRHGAGHCLTELVVLIEQAQRLLTHTVSPSGRQPVAAVVADGAALAAWQALDLGHAQRSWHLYETAKAAAHEAHDTSALAHATAEQAYVLSDLGNQTDARTLVTAALSTAGDRVPTPLQAWLLAVSAEIHALAGHARQARRQIDHACTLDTSEHDLPYLSLNHTHLTRWRGAILAGLGDQEAISHLMAARQRMDPSFRRARAGLETDLARAMQQRGELTQAHSHARAARALARHVGSQRQQRRLTHLHLAA